LKKTKREIGVPGEVLQKAADWKWSAAAWYEERRSVGVPIEWIE
jgi:putative transposase